MVEGTSACPFCGLEADGGQYELMLHVETVHSEGRSPFLATEDADSSFVECPMEGCGEKVNLTELAYHVELHADEGKESVDVQSEKAGSQTEAADGQLDPGRKQKQEQEPYAMSESPGRSGNETTVDRQNKAKEAWKQLFQGSKAWARPARPLRAKQVASPRLHGGKRLGKAELGRYAHEERMPDWLVSLLKEKGEIKAEGIVPVLEQLLQQSKMTEYAYLCHPAVQHISKLHREGGFCGYRNIQMLVSYIIGAGASGVERFSDSIPTIFQIQRLIEAAWDQGINAQSRIETGGIRGTRKYIGTPEAQAVFWSLGIKCDAQGFKDKEPGKSLENLLASVENYFSAGCATRNAKVMRTSLAPVYYQQPGHSMTIVGFEKLKQGGHNLLVFDPMFHDAKSVTKLVGQTFDHKNPDELLKSYRRGTKYLRKHSQFEVLQLHNAPPPDVSATS